MFGGLDGESASDDEGAASEPERMSASDFLEAFARGYCDAVEECDPNLFYDSYDDLDECYDLLEDELDESESGDCEYDAEAAWQCVDNVERLAEACGEQAYDDMQDVCDDVYDCD